MKKKHIILGVAAVAVGLVLLALLLIFMAKPAQENVAFDSSNSSYDHVQIVISQKGQNVSPVPGDEMEDTDLDIYNDNVSFGEDDSNQQEYDIEDTVTVIKDGTTYHEKSDALENYFYLRDGTEYLLSFVRDYGTEDRGEWVEQPLADTYEVKWFDFAALDAIDLEQMDKDGNRFSAKSEYLDELLALLLSLGKTVRSDYRADRITFVLDGSKIAELHIEFAYKDNLYMQYDYIFTYEDTNITLPNAAEASNG